MIHPGAYTNEVGLGFCLCRNIITEFRRFFHKNQTTSTRTLWQAVHKPCAAPPQGHHELISRAPYEKKKNDLYNPNNLNRA